MSDFWRKTAFRAAVGFALGAAVGLGFLALFGIRDYFAENGPGGVALHLGVSALLGAVCMGATTIYNLEHWGLLRCTLTHFCISMSALCAAGFTQGWFSLRDPASLWMLPANVAVYFIIWLVMYRSYKRQIRRINDALKRWKEAQGKADQNRPF